MTLTLYNIIELLEITKLYGKNKPASREYVQKTFHGKPVKQGRLPNYICIETLANTLDLIVIKNDTITLTRLGAKVLEFYNKNKPDFHEFIIKEILLDSVLSQKIYSAFSKFHVENNRKLWYPKNEIHSLFKVKDILPVLYEVELLEKKYRTVEINPKYIQLVLQGRMITQKQLDVQLENQKIIGEIAEKIVLDFERENLRKNNCMDASKKVERISEKFVNAGYDIVSFFKDEHDTIQNMYIEVKGSSGIEFDFYMSKNEFEKAQEHGEKYWIYFVSGIDVKTGSSSQEIITIQNPFERIFNNSKYTVEVEKYHIIKKNF